jgi:hypothetical protein
MYVCECKIIYKKKTLLNQAIVNTQENGKIPASPPISQLSPIGGLYGGLQPPGEPHQMLIDKHKLHYHKLVWHFP